MHEEDEKRFLVTVIKVNYVIFCNFHLEVGTAYPMDVFLNVFLWFKTQYCFDVFS